eukprot:TRINITY_DN18635_c0_g1_i1.p1 TRINITY_DN18635_c0_g1~~TRINITY_DN18635_c0_g1_i1.p1  ORF type:complete len:328 (+),score=63.93 TRINITY_DN18635_c0_g1_i1:53-985(+)
MKHSWQLSGEELEFDEEVGQGAFSHVYKGRFRGQTIAIKVLDKNVEGSDLKGFQKELEIMSSIRSPNVVFFFGAVIEPKLCLVTEFMERGSLSDVMGDKTLKFDWRLLFKLAIEAAAAMNVLHCWKPSIVHRDLKSPNLLVDKNFAVKVADFGLARFKTENNKSSLAKLRGTYAYAAPETYKGETYTNKSDVYSFAIILWELVKRNLSGEHQLPFSEYKHLRFAFQIIIQTAKYDLRPTVPANCPAQVKTMIEACWHKDPENRYEFSEIVEKLKVLQTEYDSYSQKKSLNNCDSSSDTMNISPSSSTMSS